MQQIFKFIEKYRYFLLFLLLEIVALFFTINHHSYHKSKFINSANFVTGGIYKRISSINEFFSLKKENSRLVEENIRLKNLLELTPYKIDSSFTESIDTSFYYQKFKFTSAKITNNSYKSRNNFLTINKGTINGITPEMAVVNSHGIIGVTHNVSKHNATVISILNNYSQINVKLKNNDHFGSLTWNGKDYKTVQLLDLPRQAQLKVGDTIITGGKSAIFPEGILVGTIKDVKINNNTFEPIDIALFNDMSSIKNINIITNLEKQEIKELEARNNE
ncbi:rod shape-determining protein MreC [Urechidicola vernalis]|uniref:Cell shape-determining protein MreC n=1 Tax=Urechidicola vernalis TaxID=3075600 RepID=A0ABU2Y664_9FLAO|nr:rod shape-determining protein MreC [Urechidicola sp. P050]MDT0553260.1 rod shape-determining protein MreC [Urechidicola sp. P050]